MLGRRQLSVGYGQQRQGDLDAGLSFAHEATKPGL